MENKELTKIALEFARTCGCDRIEYLGDYEERPVYQGFNYFDNRGGYRGIPFLISFDNDQQPYVIQPDDIYMILAVVNKGKPIY